MLYVTYKYIMYTKSFMDFMLHIIIIIITKLRNYRKQPYWALYTHILRKVLT